VTGPCDKVPNLLINGVAISFSNSTLRCPRLKPLGNDLGRWRRKVDYSAGFGK
jgi:hypothetical protein